MARSSTTSDAFNAVAEPQRRQILNLLAQGERSVNDIAAAMTSQLAAQDVILLGRVTYQEWAPYWPTSTDEPFASFINNTPKYVVSTTLDKVEWQNSTLLKAETR